MRLRPYQMKTQPTDRVKDVLGAFLEDESKRNAQCVHGGDPANHTRP